MSWIICDLRKYAGYEIIKMTADIVECSEVDADLVIGLLCRTSKCGESPDSRRCWEYCWCWFLAVSAEADNHVCCAVLCCSDYGCALYMPTLCSVWLTVTWFIGNIRRQCSTCNSRLRGRRLLKCHIYEKYKTGHHYLLLKWWTSPPCRWLAFILLAHTPGLWPGYAVATLCGLSPWRAVRG